MTNEECNSIFLKEHCQSIELSKAGYIQYKYTPFKKLGCIIAIKEENYEVSFTEDEWDGMYFYVGQKQYIDKHEYLSKRIHQFC